MTKRERLINMLREWRRGMSSPELLAEQIERLYGVKPAYDLEALFRVDESLGPR